jgi:hypothetical protein
MKKIAEKSGLLMTIFLGLAFIFYIIIESISLSKGTPIDSGVRMACWIIFDLLLFGFAILGNFVPTFKKVGKVSIAILLAGNFLGTCVSFIDYFSYYSSLQGSSSDGLLAAIYTLVGIVGLGLFASIVLYVLANVLPGQEKLFKSIPFYVVLGSCVLLIVVGILFLAYAGNFTGQLYQQAKNTFTFTGLDFFFLAIMWAGLAFGYQKYLVNE